MRAFKRNGKRGFTLVELMIVVAIIGVLAALAIYGVRKYLASAKTSEAKNTVGAISRGAAAAYEREIAPSEYVAPGTNSSAASRQLCLAATAAVPASVPAGTKYTPNGADGSDFETGDQSSGWRCLRFAMTDPIYYSYMYETSGTLLVTSNAATYAAGLGFEASARGDLDGDATDLSGFARTATIESSGQLNISPQLQIENEFE